MGAGAALEIVGRRREAGWDLGFDGCCGRGGSIYVMGYEIGDGGGGDIVYVGEGREKEDGCRFFVG